MPQYDLQGRVIAITGASSGIGEATALACAEAGMDVALGGRRVDRLEAVAEKIRAMGRRALPFRCDVDKPEDADRFIAQTVEQLGRLDVVFANAGYGLFASVLTTSDAQMRAIFETNFHGTLRVIKAAVPILVKQGHGRVLICSSAASKIGPPMYGAYAATKAAQESIASALRAELRGTGVSVSSVHPVGTDTEFFRHMQAVSGPEAGASSTTPIPFRQTSEKVARSIVRAMGKRNPPPEIWPRLGARFGLALVAAFPRIGAWAMRKRMGMLMRR